MKVIGAVVIVLSLVIAILPMFTDCQSQGNAIALANGKTVPMKCHWTGRAELAMGGPILAVGAFMVGSRRKQVIRSIALLGMLLGGLVILLPTLLIGVCTNPSMFCNMIMKPALIFSGILVIAGSGAALLLTREVPEIEH